MEKEIHNLSGVLPGSDVRGCCSETISCRSPLLSCRSPLAEGQKWCLLPLTAPTVSRAQLSPDHLAASRNCKHPCSQAPGKGLSTGSPQCGIICGCSNPRCGKHSHGNWPRGVAGASWKTGTLFTNRKPSFSLKSWMEGALWSLSAPHEATHESTQLKKPGSTEIGGCPSSRAKNLLESNQIKSYF